MTFRTLKIKKKYIIIASVFAVLAAYVLNMNRMKSRTPYYAKQIAAAEMMKNCVEKLDTFSFEESGLDTDPIFSNLIGVEYSEITTTLGNLNAKRLSANPDFAALLLRWFKELELKQGDKVAIGCSGSFPALSLAAICAAEIGGFEPVIISSVGASSYGANRPNLTYLDIEKYLFDNKIIHYRSVAASPGGVNDIASDLSEEGRKLINAAVKRNHLHLIYEDNLSKNVNERKAIYNRNGDVKLFVNIGGAQINVGDYYFEKKLHTGVNISRFIAEKSPRSMSGYFISQNLPIIHLLHIEQLVLETELDVNPVSFSKPGKNAVYYEIITPAYLYLISIVFFSAAIIFLFIGKIRYNRISAK